MDMSDTVSIVTGAARGIGKAVSLAMATQGSTVVLVDRDEKPLRETTSELMGAGGMAISVVADLSGSEGIDTVIDTALCELKRIDLLVNNAGLCSRYSVSETSEGSWNQLMDVNLKGCFFLSQKVLAVMKEQKSGKIINMGSLAGKVGGIAVGPDYAASKAGVISMTKSLARDAAPYGITVNCVCPGVIMTDITSAAPENTLEEYKKAIPLGRIGTPEDVANAVVFLASSDADYITGEVLDVNGGLLMD